MPHTSVVIVVDDHEDSREMYALALAASGFHVVTTATAEEAFDLAQRLRADVVVADVRLPGASGLELTQQLRGDHRTKNMAVVLLTGDAGVRTPGFEAGCDRFLVKPIAPDALSAEIAAVVAERAHIVAPVAQSAAPPMY